MKVYTSNCLVILFGLLGLSSAIIHEKNVKKRQIYREQVLPHAGGKIPESAFQSDRLILNRLQKEGIAIPDGVILEQRNPQVHQYYNKAARAVLHVAATLDNRYTPPEGRYLYRSPPSIETTYLIPQIHNYPIQPGPKSPILPVYRPLRLPSSVITENAHHGPKKNSVYFLSYDSKHTTPKTSNSFDFFDNALPLGALSWTQYQRDYITSQIFSDFENFFNSFNLRNRRSTTESDSTLQKSSI